MAGVTINAQRLEDTTTAILAEEPVITLVVTRATIIIITATIHPILGSHLGQTTRIIQAAEATLASPLDLVFIKVT